MTTAEPKRPHTEFLQAMAEARMQASGLRTGFTSPDGSVRVVISGDRQLASLHLSEEALADHTEDSLAEEIIEAYNGGQRQVFTEQIQIFADTFAPSDRGPQ